MTTFLVGSVVRPLRTYRAVDKSPRFQDWAGKHSAQGRVMSVDAVSPEDVADVLGELANIVGGNVKAMLPPGASLSLPRVVLAAVSPTGFPGEKRITALYGLWKGEPVAVSMWQSARS